MTTRSDETTAHDRQVMPPPPLTPATIKRAYEGLLAARDPHARAGVRATLANLERLLDGRADQRLNGATRQRLLQTLMSRLFRLRVAGQANIPTGPVMLAPNHLNHIDPFILLAIVPPQPYYYVIGDARTLYNKPWKRAVIRQVGGVIPLDRVWKEERAVMAGAAGDRPDLADLAAGIARDVPDGGSIEALRRMEQVVQAIFARGDAILLFPEGALGTREGALHLPLKRGAISYAARAGVPIVPVGISGTHDLYLGKEITVRFGPPLALPAGHLRPRETQAQVERLRVALLDLLPSDYHEPTGPKPLRHLLTHMLW